MKLKITLIASSLLFAECKHEEAWMHQVNNEKRTTSVVEIHQKIPGTWIYDTQYDNGSGGNFCHIITLGSDGNFSVSCTNETEQVVGTWRLQEPVGFITNKLGRVVEERPLQDQGSCLVVTTAKTNYLILSSGKMMSMGNLVSYPIVYVDDHELILTPGPSVAGRYRFTR